MCKKGQVAFCWLVELTTQLHNPCYNLKWHKNITDIWICFVCVPYTHARHIFAEIFWPNRELKKYFGSLFSLGCCCRCCSRLSFLSTQHYLAIMFAKCFLNHSTNVYEICTAFCWKYPLNWSLCVCACVPTSYKSISKKAAATGGMTVAAVSAVEITLLFVLFLWIFYELRRECSVYEIICSGKTRKRQADTGKSASNLCNICFHLTTHSGPWVLFSICTLRSIFFSSASSHLVSSVPFSSSAFGSLFRKLKYYIFEFQFHFHAYKQQSK